MDELDIGEVRRRTGLPASALRYYEQCGLIRSSGRNGLRRRYPPDVLDRLALVAAGRSAGFTLAETAELLEITSADTELRQRIAAKADELDRRIKLLADTRDQLRHAVDCTSPRLIDCPSFKQYVRSLLPAGASQPQRHLPTLA